MTRYLDMLREKIQEFVRIYEHKNLFDLVEVTRFRKLDLETQEQKRRQDQTHVSTKTINKVRVTGIRSGCRETSGFYDKCGLTHLGIFHALVLDVSDAVTRATTARNVVIGSLCCISFVVSRAMLKLYVL